MYKKVLVNNLKVDKCENAKLFYADDIEFEEVIQKIHHDEIPQAIKFQSFKQAKELYDNLIDYTWGLKLWHMYIKSILPEEIHVIN